MYFKSQGVPMTKKITISVPDELHEKMTIWRDHFNFSKVFQDAVGGLIKQKEDFKKRLKGKEQEMEAIIERLKREKEESDHEWIDQGKLDGLDFAKSAHYDELQYALRWETVKEIQEKADGYPLNYSPAEDDVLGDYFRDIIMDEDILEPLGMEESSPGNYAPNQAYAEWENGWKEGIKEFWNEIKSKL